MRISTYSQIHLNSMNKFTWIDFTTVLNDIHKIEKIICNRYTLTFSAGRWTQKIMIYNHLWYIFDKDKHLGPEFCNRKEAKISICKKALRCEMWLPPRSLYSAAVVLAQNHIPCLILNKTIKCAQVLYTLKLSSHDYINCETSMTLFSFWVFS